MYSENYVKEFYNSLIDLKNELLEDLKQNKKFFTQDLMNFNQTSDIIDQSINYHSKEISISLYSQAHHKLKDIEGALTRIQEKTFGTCEECTEIICFNRLKAIPYTSFCIDCKAKNKEPYSSP